MIKITRDEAIDRTAEKVIYDYVRENKAKRR